MQLRSPLRTQASLALFLAAVSSVLLPSVHAATIIKADNNLNLDQATSWAVLSVGPPIVQRVPNENDVAQWTSAVSAANTTSNLGSNTAWLGISIVAPASAVTLNGNTLTLGMGGIDMSLATADLNINSNLTTKAYTNQVWNVGTGRTLTLDQGVFTRSVGSTVNIQGLGIVDIGPTSTGIANNVSTGIVGPWLTIGTGATTRYALVDAATGNLTAFNPGAVTAPASIVAAPNTNFDMSATSGAFGAGASVNTLRHSGAASTIAGDLQANGIMNAGTGVLTLSGNVNIGASRELVLDAANNSLTFSGVISDNVGGASSITKTGNTVAFNNNNTYTGDTHINRGTLIITQVNSLGTTAGATYINGGDNATGGNPVLPGGQLRIDGGAAPGGGLTIAENFFVYGRSNGQNPIAFNSNSGNNTLTGLYTLAGSGGGSRVNVATGTRLTIAGGVAVTADQSGLFILNPQGTGVLSFTTNSIILKSNGTFYFDSGGTVELGTTSNVWGITMLVSGTLKMMTTNALPAAASINMGASYGSNNETLDLNGFSQNTGFISNTSNNVANPVNRRITNSSATAATLTLNQTTNGTYQGFTSGNLSIVKRGGLTLTLNSTGTHTGDTRVEAGTLALANIDALSTSTLDTHTSGTQAVTFTAAGTNTYNLGGLKGSDDLALLLNNISVGANNQSTTFAAAITSTGGGLTKVGTGTLRLSNASTYTGGTTVSNGTLLANNATGTSATGTGAVTVQSGGSIGGNGFITTAAVSGVTIQSGGILSPGDAGPDRLTISAAINLNAGAIFDTKLAIGGIAGEGNGATGTSLLDANGAVSITGSTLSGIWGGSTTNLFDGGTLTNDHRLWLIDNDGSDAITGMFANASILGDASVQAMFGGSASAYTTTLSGQQFAVFYNANFDTSALTGGNDLLLVAIAPEPMRGMFLVLAFGAILLHRRRNRASIKK